MKLNLLVAWVISILNLSCSKAAMLYMSDRYVHAATTFFNVLLNSVQVYVRSEIFKSHCRTV